MRARLANEDDEDALVDWLLQRPMSSTTAWILAPTDDGGARADLARWSVRNALEYGVTIIDDLGRAVGGIGHPLPSPVLRHEGGILARSTGFGGLLYPRGLPGSCRSRLYAVAQANETLRPPRPAQLLSVGDPSGWVPGLLADYQERVGKPLSIVTGTEEQVLGALGFRRIAGLPASRDGRPALQSWLWEAPGD